MRRETTALVIDGNHLASAFTATAKPADWGNQTDARLQVEIISVDPGPNGNGALHKAQVKDWFWNWEL